MSAIDGRPNMLEEDDHPEFAADLIIKECLKRRIAPAQALGSGPLQEHMGIHPTLDTRLLPDKSNQLVVNGQNIGLRSESHSASFVKEIVRPATTKSMAGIG
jgi:hypothetical protein